MKHLGFIEKANYQTKTTARTTKTDDTQFPRPDLRFTNEKQSKTRNGAKAKQTATQKAPDLPLTQRRSHRVVKITHIETVMLFGVKKNYNCWSSGKL